MEVKIKAHKKRITKQQKATALRKLLSISALNVDHGSYKCIENVDKWSYFGHLITVNCNDHDDIQARINCLIGQVNHMLCFSQS